MAGAGSEEEHKTMPDLRMMYQLSNDLQDAQQRQYQQICKRKRQKWLEIVGAECMVRVRQAASWLVQSTRTDEKLTKKLVIIGAKVPHAFKA